MTIKDELLAIKGSKEFLICEEAETWARSNPQSDLYHALEWDDARAGHEYRLVQIRHLVQIHITYADATRKFVSLSIDRTRSGGGYRDIDAVLADQALHDIMMADALRELERVRQRYEQLKQLQPIWAAVGRVRGAQTRKQRRKGGGRAQATA